MAADKTTKKETGFAKHPENINRKGRPKGSVSILDVIRNKLQEIPPGERRTYAEKIAEMTVRAAAGEVPLLDGTSLRDLIDRIDGKPTSSLELTGANKGPIEIGYFKDFEDL